MTANSSVFLVPLVLAFVLFLGKVYGQERAVTRGSLSFALAVLTVLLLFSYLALNVFLAALPPYTGVAYGAAGAILVGVAVLLIRVY